MGFYILLKLKFDASHFLPKDLGLKICRSEGMKSYSDIIVSIFRKLSPLKKQQKSLKLAVTLEYESLKYYIFKVFCSIHQETWSEQFVAIYLGSQLVFLKSMSDAKSVSLTAQIHSLITKIFSFFSFDQMTSIILNNVVWAKTFLVQ